MNIPTTSSNIPHRNLTTATAPAPAPAPAPAMEMDSRIWRNLPQPLVDRVIAFLPPPAFFRSLSVCKRFYSLLFSDSFLRLHLSLPLPLPSFLFFPSAAAVAPFAFLFDPYASTWHRIPLPSPTSSSFSPSASSGGLLLLLSEDPGAKSIILLNPLSKLAARLPPAPRPRLLPSVGLAVGPSSLTLVLAGDDMISPFAVKNLTSETFHADGATGFFSPWATVSPLPRLCSLEPGRMVYLHGKFYCMCCAPFSVLVYDVGSNVWDKMQTPMRRFLRSPSLAVARERVVMMAGVEKMKLSVPRSIRVWELQDEGRGWAEVERMPTEFRRQFEEAEGGRGFECVGSGEFVAVTVKGSTDMVLFDFRRREWRWAPHCPFVGGGAGLRGLGYEPRLATPAVGLIDSATMAVQGFSG